MRLFTEVQARNRELTETLEQQTATGEILRVISSSPTDLQPVLDAVARNAARVCEASDSSVYRIDGDSLRLAASYATASLAAREKDFRLPIARGSVTGRAVIDRQIVHVHDLSTEPAAEFPEGKLLASRFGYRTVLAAPLLREGVPIGGVVIRRTEVRPFTDKQIDLLKTFADQAVIAIENVRLFTELQARNRDLTETLEQQTATSEILRVISSSPTDLQPVFDIIAESAIRLCGAEVSTVTRFDGEWVHLEAVFGSNAAGVEALRRTFPMRPTGAGGAVRAIRDCAIVEIPDVLADQEYRIQGTAMTAGFHALLAVPMLREGRAIGAITVGRAEAGRFDNAQVQLLRTFADQAVIAIENVRLFKELEVRNRDLTETLEQQMATGEILRVISSSPTDIQPVLDTIVRSAVRLCDGLNGAVNMFDGDVILHPAAFHNYTVEALAAVERMYPMRPTRQQLTGRAILSRTVAHVPDVMSDPEYAPDIALAGGWRSAVAAPMLREAHPIGTILVTRMEAGPFSDRQIDLLKTFADQAVIAIENVRLFQELEARNRDLTETLEQQTATAEILRVISSSPTDVQPVFDTIVASAVRLCGARMGAVYRFDGELMHLVAHRNYSPEVLELLQRMHPRPPQPDQASGKAVLTRAVAQIEDMLADPSYVQAVAVTGGWRSILAVPMLRDGVPSGAIVITRSEAGPFSDGHVELVKTFADQAVIAVENVRLFTELEARNRELTETLDQQTATSEVLKVISRSAFDLQPVLESVIESATRLCGATRGHIFRFDGEFLRFAVAYGASPEFTDYLATLAVRPDAGSISGRAASERRPVHVADVLKEQGYEYGGLQERHNYRAVLAVPMLREGALLGVIAIVKAEAEPFTDKQIELVDDVRRPGGHRHRERPLVPGAGDSQPRVDRDARSSDGHRRGAARNQSRPDRRPPVFDIIAASALRLCSGGHSGVWLYDGELIHLAALDNVTPEGTEALRRAFPIRADERSATGRAILAREAAQITDVLEDRAYGMRSSAQAVGFPSSQRRLFCGLPSRSARPPRTASARAVPRDQVELLQSFADQAVIAIEISACSRS